MTTSLRTNQLVSTAIRYYFITGIVEAVGALIFLVMIPTDPKNAWILGFSKTRLLMVLVMLIIALVFLLFSILGWRDSHWVSRFKKRIQSAFITFGKYLPGMVITYAIVICGGFLIFYLYLTNHNLTTRAGVILRLSPFVLLGFTRAVQLAIVLIVLIYKLIKPEGPKNGYVLIQINPQKITFFLASIALLLILISAMVDIMEIYTWELPMLGFRQKIDVDREANIPTFYSTFVLGLAASLLGLVAYIKRSRLDSYRYHWLILSLIFVFFALDETAGLHEKAGQFLKTVSGLQFRGIFHYGWEVLGVIFVALMGFTYLKFILDLPRGYRKMFTVSIGLFFLGALGVEMLTGWYTDAFKKTKAMDTLLTSVEEALEFGGGILLVHFLLTYIRDLYPLISFTVTDKTNDIE